MNMEDNEAGELRNQLREEQRKTKRLEKDVQRLEDRNRERNLQKGAVGSAAHFEWNEVEFGPLMNQGGFSVVHTGTWHSTKVAIKKIFDPNITAELLAEFDNEIAKLEQIRHPNIIQLLAVHRKPPALSLITELVEGGSFFQLLHARHQFTSASGPISEVQFSDAMQIMESTAVALTFLHARGMIHRDVKSHNILLSPHLEVKLCDFGLARMRSELMTGAMQFAGTPCYMAPEIFRQQRYCDKVDVFAFGTTLWEAMAQDLPFANLEAPEIKEKVLMGQMLQFPGSTPRKVQALTQACWILDQDTRPMMKEVLIQIRDCGKDPDSMSGAAAKMARRPRTAGVAGRDRSGITQMGTFANNDLSRPSQFRT
jgi:serine/threonine protein kinase